MYKFHLISFGSNPDFLKLSDNILRKIHRNYPNSIPRRYSKENLSNSVLNYCEMNLRGYGYWLWKPFIILDLLNGIKDNEVLLYVDGRSGFNGNEITWLNNFIDNPDFDIALWKLESYSIGQWTKQSALDYFNISVNSEITALNQYAAGIICLRKNSNTFNLIQKWLSISLGNPSLIDDSMSISKIDNFQEHRYDQSIFSILIRLTPNLNILELVENDIYSINSVVPYFYQHPQKGKFTLINSIPLDLQVKLNFLRPYVKKMVLFFKNIHYKN